MQLDRHAPPWTDRLASQFRCPNAVEAAVFRLWLRSVLVRSNANGWVSGVQFRTTTRIELIVRAPSEAAFVNQSSRLRPFRAARSAYLRPLACAPSCRTTCPTLHVHQVAHHRLVADRPNDLSAAVPCVQRAFAAYPRPGEAGPAVFHGPIARGQALDSPGLPRPTDADEQTTNGSAFQIGDVSRNPRICCALHIRRFRLTPPYCVVCSGRC